MSVTSTSTSCGSTIAPPFAPGATRQCGGAAHLVRVMARVRLAMLTRVQTRVPATYYSAY